MLAQELMVKGPDAGTLKVAFVHQAYAFRVGLLSWLNMTFVNLIVIVNKDTKYQL